MIGQRALPQPMDESPVPDLAGLDLQKLLQALLAQSDQNSSMSGMTNAASGGLMALLKKRALAGGAGSTGDDIQV